MKSVPLCAAELWEKVCLKVNKAVVFIDNPSAEILHWHGGLNLLVKSGAEDVREFSPFENTKTAQKALFIVSSLLEDSTKETLHNIIEGSRKLQYVIVIATLSPAVHLFSRTGSLDGDESSVFANIEERILEWMGNMNYTVEVFHLPLFSASISSNLFVTPIYSELFPLLQTDVKGIKLQSKGDRKNISRLQDVESSQLPKELQIFYKSFICGFNGLLEELGVQEECYSVGHTSRILATELANYGPARHRRKSAQSKAAVIFVDRTMDLTAPCGHQTELLMDKLVHILPRFPGHHNDLKVEMSGLCNVHKNLKPLILPGCLASVKTSTSQSHLLPLFTSKQKEAVMEINRQLVEAATKENLPVKLTGKPGRVTAEQLENTLNLFKNNLNSVHNNIDTLQVAMATYHLLKDSANHHHDNKEATEKLILQNYGTDETENPLSQIQNLLSEESGSQRSHTLDDVLCLLLYVYTMFGEECLNCEEEDNLKTSLTSCLLREKDKLPPLTQEIFGKTLTKSIVTDIVEDMWDKLEAIATVRCDHKQLTSVVEPGNMVNPAMSKPFLKQMIDLIFDPSKPELHDINIQSSGFSDLLKSGFGLFRSVNKPRPSDHPLLIIFVVGGITASEVKQIKDTVSAYKTNTQVIVGSTQLVGPKDIAKYVFCQDRLHPAT